MYLVLRVQSGCLIGLPVRLPLLFLCFCLDASSTTQPKLNPINSSSLTYYWEPSSCAPFASTLRGPSPYKALRYRYWRGIHLRSVLSCLLYLNRGRWNLAKSRVEFKKERAHLSSQLIPEIKIIVSNECTDRVHQTGTWENHIGVEPVEIQAFNASVCFRIVRKYGQTVNNHLTSRTPTAASIFKHFAQLLKDTRKVVHSPCSIQVPRPVLDTQQSRGFDYSKSNMRDGYDSEWWKRLDWYQAKCVV